jgi:DNA-binding transcriptional LysR family regulator
MTELVSEPSPADMLVFADVVREGSFTKAAKRRGITKQSVSERVAKLEAALGLRLLERTTRLIRVTEAGALYVQRCSAIAAMIEEANQELRNRHTEPTGPLRISAPYLYGRKFLAPVIAEYLAKYPNVHIDLALSDRRTHLIEEGFDLAIRIGQLDNSSLTARKIGEAYVYYVVATDLARKVIAKRLAAGLEGLPVVGTRSQEVWDISGKKHKVSPRLVVNDLEVACELACLGYGIARIPALVCRKHVLDGTLTILWRESARREPVSLLYPSAKYLPPKVRMFAELLVRVQAMDEIVTAPDTTRSKRKM